MASIAARVDRPKYLKPSLEPVTIRGIPGVKVYVLGPPTDEARLAKDDPSSGAQSEVYLGAGSGLPPAFFGR